MKNSLCFTLSPPSLFTGVVAFSMLALVGCGDDDPPTPQTPTSGSIFGSVALYDELGMDIDDANMTITVEGMSRSATTDINGDFTIENVPLGTHNLVFSKQGFGTFKVIDFDHDDHQGSTLSMSPSLSELCTTTITDLSVTSNANEIEITYEMSPAANSNNPRYARAFLFEGSNISPANYTAFTEVRQANSSPTTITITASELSDFGFTSGEQIYVRVYGDSFYSNDYQENGASVFPNVNLTSAQAVSVVVP